MNHELLAGFERALDQPQLVLSQAEQALQDPSNKAQFYAACLLKGETLLRLKRPREALLALAPALGIQEHMGQEFSGLSLALLAEAQAAWGKKAKAIQTAHKALTRSNDAYSKSRASYALWLASGETQWLEAARHEATDYPPWLAYLSGCD
jgi:tetratricopeptide (TPR) repeat protein